MEKQLLKVKGVSKRFGGLQALYDVSFDMVHKSIYSLIGPNGAGKTTTLNLISGVFPWEAGTIEFMGQNLKRKSPDMITSLGLTRTFQGGGLFNNLTVIENSLLGYQCRFRSGFISNMLSLPKSKKEKHKARERAEELLTSFGLEKHINSNLEDLPISEQRLVEISCALALKPKLLLLDEPAAGLNDTESQGLVNLLFDIRTKGTSILLIEHNMDVVMKVSDQIVVLDYGRTLVRGTPIEIQNNEQVIKAYLGA